MAGLVHPNRVCKTREAGCGVGGSGGRGQRSRLTHTYCMFWGEVPIMLLEVTTTTGCHAGVLTGACPSRERGQLVCVISTSAYVQLTTQQLHGLLCDAARLHDGTSSLLQNTKVQADSLDCNGPVCIPDDWKLDFDLQ